MNKSDQKLFEEFLAFKKFQESKVEIKDNVTKPKTARKNKLKKRADGRYAANITVGRNSETGKPIRITVYGKTITELNENKNEVKMEYLRGTNVEKRNITMQVYRKNWYKNKQLSFTENSHHTKSMYESILNNYFDILDPMMIREITLSDLQEIITINKDKPRTCQKIKMVFNQIFKSAIKDRIIHYNPCDGLMIPVYEAPEKRNLTEDENTLSEITCFTDREKTFITLIKYFGLRKEEALGVQKSDFDFNNSLLHINRALIFVHNQPVLKETKNKEKRILPMLPNTKAFLKYIVSNTPDNEPIFCNIKNKSYMTEQGYRRMWQSICKKMEATGKAMGLKIEPDLTAHIFRHNYAYLLMHAEIDMKERQYLLGHKTISVTMDIYTHIEKKKMRAPKQLEEYAHKFLHNYHTEASL